MRQLVARFDEASDAEAAEAALRDADFEPDQPNFANPLFNPASTVPEERGFIWGGVLGGTLGILIISTTYLNLFVVPRFSPMMSADPLSLLVLGAGLGVVGGGFVGGVVGTLRPVSPPDDHVVAVAVPDNQVDHAEDILRSHEATAVEGRVTYHEDPGMWQTESRN